MNINIYNNKKCLGGSIGAILIVCAISFLSWHIWVYRKKFRLNFNLFAVKVLLFKFKYICIAHKFIGLAI